MRASLFDLTVTWPDGSTVLSAVSADFGPGRHGVVGANGAGKSTLIRALAGLVTPTGGSSRIDGPMADFDAVGDDWDVVGRTEAMLGRLGLDHLELGREMATLSGGEHVLLALAGLLLTGPDVLLLDEPTNNLDRIARARLLDVMCRPPVTGSPRPSPTCATTARSTWSCPRRPCRPHGWR